MNTPARCSRTDFCAQLALASGCMLRLAVLITAAHTRKP